MRLKNQTYLDQSAQIKEKLRNRDYRIGLDLGVGSIGFAILSMEENSQKILLPTEIIMSGSRIFKSSDGAINRRTQRGQRNNHRHARERMRYLWKLLASQKLALSVPANLERKENSSEQETSYKRFSKEVLQKDVYELRVKALDEKISPQEIGYALYHIANHRGSSAIRTFEEDSEETKKENTENKRIAGEAKRAMKEKNYRTYGEYLYREKFENKERHKRERVSNTIDNHQFSPTRDFAIEEARAILKNQAQYHKELTDDYIKQIKEAINYETEKLIPDSGDCPYFKNEKRLPRSHKLNEERRIWEALNNARYSQPVVDEKTGEITSYEEKQFSKEQKELLSKHLLEEKLTQDKTRKLLKLENVESQDIVLQGRDKKTQKIEGYKLRELEATPFWKRLSEEQQEQFLYDWNSYPDEKVLKDKLKKEYKLTDEEIDKAFAKVVLPSSYAPLGKSAMIIVLEKIKAGLSYTEAIEEALKEGKLTKDKQSVKDKLPYYGAVLPESTQAIIAKGFSKQFANRKYKTPYTNKDELKYGRIANPVVHQTLNELRKLVNEVIEIFGKKPVEIGLETARELKKSVKDRGQLSKEQSDNESRRNKIYETYIKKHQQTIETRNENPTNYILKFELFEEQKEICPFCLQPINADDIINNKVDKEHLFPISESEDNTRNNLVISHASCNQKKGKRSPFNAFGSSPKEDYDYNGILKNAKQNLPKKAWRFHQGTFEKFIENKPMKKRFETDNSYISKVAHKYLSCLFEKPNIICVKGSLTAQLRLAWDLQGILIPFAKALVSDKEIENFNNDVNNNKKIRLDNRNHALDAIVIAFASRGYENLLNKLAGQGYKIDYKPKNWLSKILLPPNNNDRQLIEEDLKSFKDSIKKALNNSFISVKHDHNDNGELRKATMYKIYDSKDGYTLTTRKKLREIKLTDKKKTPKKVLETALLKFEGRQDELKNKKIKDAVDNNKKLFDAIQNNLQEAESSLTKENEKAKTEGKKETSINEISIYEKAISLLGRSYYIQLSKRDPRKFFAVSKPSQTTKGYGYDTGDNLCIDLYRDKKGKLQGEIIRKIDAQRKIQPKYKEKFVLFERIYGGDILEVDYITNNNGKLSLKNRCNSAHPNRTFIRVNTYTETKNNIQLRFSNIIKSDKKKDDSFTLNSMQEYNPRKVILSPCGLIKYRSPILKDIVK
ncbi:MAG: type II CRISPR RNA-guided endonuclease Cas9 [Endomicrobium sp.]|jgi:CRISPR-associated endonuclease Csn1|nr:type II CRISPR RNA-guided endonuclease Cas9 [Endomicrobium sp.]